MNIIKQSVKQLQSAVKSLGEMECTFWACERYPENNRIKSMVTCSRCQSIIILNRHIKKLKAI